MAPRSTPRTPTGKKTDPGGGAPVGALARRIAGKALPLYASMLSALAGSIVTAGVLGNTSTPELAAHALLVAVSTPVLMTVQGALRGSLPFIAENAEDPGALAPVVRDSTWLALVLGAVGGLLVAALPLLSPLIEVAGPTQAALGSYPLFMGAHVLLASAQASATVLLVGLGHNRAVLVLSLTGTALTLVLVPALVLGAGPVPGLGLPGAGAAMLAATGLTLAASLIAARRLTVLRGRRVGLGPPRWARIGAIAGVGLPAGSTLLIKFGAMSALAPVVARTSAEEAAAHQLLVLVAAFAFLPATAVGQAYIPFTARAAASGDRARGPGAGTPHGAGRPPGGPAGRRGEHGAGLGRGLPPGGAAHRGRAGARGGGRARAGAVPGGPVRQRAGPVRYGAGGAQTGHALDVRLHALLRPAGRTRPRGRGRPGPAVGRLHPGHRGPGRGPGGGVLAGQRPGVGPPVPPGPRSSRPFAAAPAPGRRSAPAQRREDTEA